MEGLKVDLPYPSVEGIGEDPRSVRIISPAYADRGSEMTAILYIEIINYTTYKTLFYTSNYVENYTDNFVKYF